ncbi:MAG: S-layer homology domain-containing protein [Clostridiales bacterium]|jgi:hypothetical protein|nr:S-layer homology domain-containing protein [Clostridiales bacterium]
MKKFMHILLSAALLLTFAPRGFADADVDAALRKTAAYVYRTVPAPVVDPVGGEWAVFGLARSGYDVPDAWFAGYYQTVADYARTRGGVLHERRYTDYSRVVLGLTAAGYDPRSVGGYDLTAPLADFDKTIWQGVNGAIFALLALDGGGYDNPNGARYVAEILRRQLPGGGFNLTADGVKGMDGAADPDITAMALQALAKYREREDVTAASERAIACLSEAQNADGGYARGADPTAESTAQVIIALCELGIDLDDARFIKNGIGLLDNLLRYQNEDGSFRHTDGSSGGGSQMATEQALCALAAVCRAAGGENSLYHVTDAVRRTVAAEPTAGAGLPGKRDEVTAVAITAPGKTFADLAGHASQAAAEALAERGIIDGKAADRFDPDAHMTRAEYAAVVTRGLGLEARQVGVFADVTDGDWFAGYVGAAYTYGIVAGTSDAAFDPNGVITRQEAALMTARAAALCGMKIDLDAQSILDTLARFGDYTEVADWARGGVAFCFDAGILSDSEFDIQPSVSIKRGEIAQMLYNMLCGANLI